MDIIHGYFCNHDVVAVTETPTHYRVTLARCNFTYCENMGEGLQWLGINAEDVGLFHISGRNSFLCLLESWIPYAWSRFLAEAERLAEDLAIIHVDDHTDLMSPEISSDNGKWKDMFTGEAVWFSDPESVRKAVMSGAITLGSMMTPLIHHVDKADVYHMIQDVESALYGIRRTMNPDSLLDPEQQRIAVELNNTTGLEHSDGSIYLRTSRFSDVSKRIGPDADVFLHVDMDYFNNRFNGSTDWMDRSSKRDPSITSQKRTMRCFSQHLLESGLVGRIRHTSIGISPSFYPSEFWQEGIHCLLAEFDGIGLDVTDLIEQLT